MGTFIDENERHCQGSGGRGWGGGPMLLVWILKGLMSVLSPCFKLLSEIKGNLKKGCCLSQFHFTCCRYFLGHVSCRNLPWQSLKWGSIISTSKSWSNWNSQPRFPSAINLSGEDGWSPKLAKSHLSIAYFQKYHNTLSPQQRNRLWWRSHNRARLQIKCALFTLPTMIYHRRQTTTPGTTCPTLCDKCAGSFTSHRIMNIEGLWDGTSGLSSLSEKTRESNHLQM